MKTFKFLILYNPALPSFDLNWYKSVSSEQEISLKYNSRGTIFDTKRKWQPVLAKSSLLISQRQMGRLFLK